MRYIFGLGNPGKKYANTRHNAGFEVIDLLAERHGIRLKNKPKLEAKAGEGRIGDEAVMLIEPQTFMNLSGYAVSAVLDYFKADPEDIIVIYDDIDLPLGAIRIREKGSAGTHNGMRSVVGYLGTDSFVRVRLGIGRPEGPTPLASYVLSTFADSRDARKLVERGADAVQCIVEYGVARAQQEFREEKPGTGEENSEKEPRQERKAEDIQ